MGRDSIRINKKHLPHACAIPLDLRYVPDSFEIADPPTKACIEFAEWKPNTQASFLVAVRCSCHASVSIQSIRDTSTSIAP